MCVYARACVCVRACVRVYDIVFASVYVALCFYSFIISPDTVLGWTQGSVEGEEGSEAITLSLGYLKGTGPDFNANIVVSGAAGKAYICMYIRLLQSDI